jgi:hypothetical protein
MSGFKVNFSVNNQLATPAIHAAALANRPAAGQPGRVFIDTDNPSTGIYRDTGTAWIQIAATSSPEVDTLQTVTDRGNTTDNTLILTYDSLFNGSNAIEFFDIGTTATRYSITKQGTGNRLTLQGNSPLSTNDIGLMIDAPNNTLRTYWGSSFNTRGISCDFTNNIYRLGNISGTAGQQGIYVDATGSVGIGTTSPTSNSFLTIQSAAAASQLSLVLRGHNTTNAGGFRLLSSDETTVNYSVYADTTVGLSFSTTSSTYVQTISFATGTSGVILGNSSALYIRGSGSRDLSLGSNNTNDRMIIKSGGNVLIGTTTDGGQKLQIEGGAGIAVRVANSGTNAGINISNSTYPYIVFNRAGTVVKSFGIFNATGDMAIQESTGWSGANSHIFYGGGGFSTIGSGNFGNNVAANASAILQATSTTKGFLPPTMTNAQMTSIVSPATGLMVYDTTNSRLNVYDGSNWISLH